MSDTAPLVLARARVRPEWIDFNGHMTASAYVVAFDQAVFSLLGRIGVDPAYRSEAKCSTFALELHVTYRRELPADAPYTLHGRILAADAKKVHFWHEMRHAEEGWLSATQEVVNLHVDLNTRRAARFPELIAGKIDALLSEAHDLPYPDLAGGTVGLVRRRAAS